VDWVHSDEFPEKTKAHFINGRVWVEYTMERALSHNRVKMALYLTLEPLTQPIGVAFCDEMLLTNQAAGLGTAPDCMVVTRETLESGRVTFCGGPEDGLDGTELIGSPDLVIEIVSPTSVDKDTEWLMAAYHNAEIPEYWLIDARKEPLRFDIYKRGKKGYTAVRKQDGWVKSPLYGRGFRLTIQTGNVVYPTFTLEVR
jgi:Uma2 family endonuclease